MTRLVLAVATAIHRAATKLRIIAIEADTSAAHQAHQQARDKAHAAYAAALAAQTAVAWFQQVRDASATITAKRAADNAALIALLESPAL